MEYNKIVAVTGLAGLFELVSSKTDGAIVHSLEDNTTKFVSSRVHNFSHLESIEVYTLNENVNLLDVFKAMRDNKATLPDTKNNNSIKKYFQTVFPNMDFERVYASDMKKMVKWFEILKDKVEFKLPQASDEEPVKEETAEK